MNELTIILTTTEAQHTVELFNVATKAVGLDAAVIALPIIAKLKAAKENAELEAKAEAIS